MEKVLEGNIPYEQTVNFFHLHIFLYFVIYFINNKLSLINFSKNAILMILQIKARTGWDEDDSNSEIRKVVHGVETIHIPKVGLLNIRYLNVRNEKIFIAVETYKLGWNR